VSLRRYHQAAGSSGLTVRCNALFGGGRARLRRLQERNLYCVRQVHEQEVSGWIQIVLPGLVDDPHMTERRCVGIRDHLVQFAKL